jgi:predicted peroxiredoxin
MVAGVAPTLWAQEKKVDQKRARILVHVTHGPEQPTRAALAFLVAKSAIDEGHGVTLFLAGDAVLLLRDSVLDTVSGVGTGKLRDSYDAIVKGGGRFYLSGMSSQARGLTDVDLKGKPAEFAQPTVLVRLSLDHDRMFTY